MSIPMIEHAPLAELNLLGRNVSRFFYWWWVDGYSRFGAGAPMYFLFNGMTAAAALAIVFILALTDTKKRQMPAAAF